MRGGLQHHVRLWCGSSPYHRLQLCQQRAECGIRQDCRPLDHRRLTLLLLRVWVSQLHLVLVGLWMRGQGQVLLQLLWLLRTHRRHTRLLQAWRLGRLGRLHRWLPLGLALLVALARLLPARKARGRFAVGLQQERGLLLEGLHRAQVQGNHLAAVVVAAEARHIAKVQRLSSQERARARNALDGLVHGGAAYSQYCGAAPLAGQVCQLASKGTHARVGRHTYAVRRR